MSLRMSLCACFVVGTAASAVAQSSDGPRNSIVIVTGQQATVPIPTLMEGAAASVGNLEPAEQKLMDTALYETRMRFVSVASQMI